MIAPLASSRMETEVILDQDLSSTISSDVERPSIDLKSTLFKVSLFVIEQGAHPDLNAFALNLISRYYQALSLWPLDFTERIFEQSQALNAQDRVTIGQQIAYQMTPWLTPQIKELELADLYRSILAVLSRCEGNLLDLLSSMNEEILSPIKTRLNPRKLIEVEERMGATIYQAILDLPDQWGSDFLPRNVWPKLSEYSLLQSLPPCDGVFPFVAIRTSDHRRVQLFLSDDPLSLAPYIEESEWPVHCVAPLDQGRIELPAEESRGRNRELSWLSLPAHGPLTLKELIPYTDIYTALYIGEQLLETLAALHQIGVSFKDLHPSRVIVDHRFQLRLVPYLSDAAIHRSWSGRSSMRGQQLSSIYCSPEQRNGERGDIRSDLWSFGALFYELIHHRSLLHIHELSDLSIIDSTSGVVPLGEEFSTQLKLILKRCLHPNPDHRWSDAQRVLESYRPIAAEVRQSIKSKGRSAQWSKVIGEGHLRDFIDLHIEAPPHPVNPIFFAFLDEREVPLSTAEDPSILLTTLFAQEEALNEDLSKWIGILDEASQAREALIHRIKDESPRVTYDRLDELIEEKGLIQQALAQAESKISFFERRRPKLFGLALERFVKDSELDLELEQLLNLDWSQIDLSPNDEGNEAGNQENEIDYNYLGASINPELDEDLESSTPDPSPLLIIEEEDDLELFEPSEQISISFEDESIDELLDELYHDEQAKDSAEPLNVSPNAVIEDIAQDEPSTHLSVAERDDSVDLDPSAAPSAAPSAVLGTEQNEYSIDQSHIPSQERVTVEVAEVSAVSIPPESESPDLEENVEFELLRVLNGSDHHLRPDEEDSNFEPSRELESSDQQDGHSPLISLDGVSDFEDLSILERDQLPEDELSTDQYEFNDLTGIEDIPEDEDELFGILGESDPLDPNYLEEAENQVQSPEEESLTDFLELSMDSHSMDPIEVEEVFTSAPRPATLHDSLSLSIDPISEPPASEPPASEPPASEPPASEPPTSSLVDEIADSISDSELSVPDEAMISSLEQLMRLEAEGARRGPLMTPIPQIPRMTAEERRQLHQLFDRYVNLKQVYGEPIDDLNFEEFQSEIDQARATAMEIHGWETIRFTVKVRDGKVVLRAKKV